MQSGSTDRITVFVPDRVGYQSVRIQMNGVNSRLIILVIFPGYYDSSGAVYRKFRIILRIRCDTHRKTRFCKNFLPVGSELLVKDVCVYTVPVVRPYEMNESFIISDHIEIVLIVIQQYHRNSVFCPHAGAVIIDFLRIDIVIAVS